MADEDLTAETDPPETTPQVPAAKRGPPGGVKVSVAEQEARLEMVERMMDMAMSRTQMVKVAGQRFGMKPRTLDDYVARAHAKRKAEDERERPHRHPQQRRRILATIARCWLEAEKTGRMNYFALMTAETLLARMDGHLLADVAVQVNNNTTNVNQAWQGLSPEQLEFISKNEGQLPPGVTEEMLHGYTPLLAAPKAGN